MGQGEWVRGYGSKSVITGILSFGYGDALHLDEPARAADGGVGDDKGQRGVMLGEELAHGGVVGGIAEIDDGLSHILRGELPFGKEGFYVLPHAAGLADDVAGVEHLALVVDGGGAGDEAVGAVAVVHHGGALEGDAVLYGGVEVAEGLEMVLLAGLKAEDGVGVHLDDGAGGGGDALYAGGGEVVGGGGEALLGEILAACAYHAGILGVDVAHVEPGADAVVGEGAALRAERVFVGAEDAGGLLGGIAGGGGAP